VKIYSYDIANNNLEIETVEKIHFAKNNVIAETNDSYFWLNETNILDFFYYSSLYELTENQIKKLKNKIKS
jgi:hypothetical protein